MDRAGVVTDDEWSPEVIEQAAMAARIEWNGVLISTPWEQLSGSSQDHYRRVALAVLIAASEAGA